MAILAEDLLARLLKFRKERDWEQFHTPKNLAVALSVEVAELLECFQWARDEELPELVVTERAAIEDEIADIAILLSYLCNDLKIDINAAARSKIEKNAQKYPIERAFGTALKYDRLKE